MPKPGAGIGAIGKIVRKPGIAEAVHQTGLIERTAVVRDPYAR